MRGATENQGNTRTSSEYFSPRSKVKDLALDQLSPPHFTSFIQDTPMKPSQVPNQLPHPPPRRMLPLQSPEPYHRDRQGPPFSTCHLAPIHPLDFIPNSTTSAGSSANRTYSSPKDRLGPLHHCAQPFRSWLSVSPTTNGTSVNKPQLSPPRFFHPASPQFRKDLYTHPPSSRIRRDLMTESKVPLSNSESKKAQSSDIRSSIPTIQLHRPPVTPSVDTRGPREVCPPSHSEHWSPGNSDWHPSGYHSSHRKSDSSLPMMLESQDQQHKQTPSSEAFIPAVNLNYSSQKRRREFEDCNDSAKKLCPQDANSGKIQSPKPLVGNSLSTPVSQLSQRRSSVLELSPKPTDSHLCTESACDQSPYLKQSSSLKPNQPSREPPSPKPCLKRQTSASGAKQAYINYSQNHTLKLIELKSSSKPDDESSKRRREENNTRGKSSSLLYSGISHKDAGSSPDHHLGSHQSDLTQRSISVLPVNTLSRSNHVEENRNLNSSSPKPASKPSTGSLSCRVVERNKTVCPRRPTAIPDDISELFTPDPLTYVFSPAKTVKPKMDSGMTKFTTSEKTCSSSTVPSPTVTGSSCHKTQKFMVNGSHHAEETKVSSSSPTCHTQVSLPTVALERIKLENLRSFRPKDSKPQNNAVTSSGKLLKDESVKSDKNDTSLLSNSVKPSTLETDAGASECTTTFHCSQSPLLQRQPSKGVRKQQMKEEDPIDVELDIGMGSGVDMDLSESSHSSEDEQLLSLQEMMECVTKPPDPPDGALSEPSTSGHQKCQSKTQSSHSTTNPGIYKNNLDQMLKEMNSNKKAKETEAQLLTACQEDLLKIAEFEEAEENQVEGISTEHQEFLQRYSLMSIAIREVPPGHNVFNLEKFGQLFNHDTLQLRQCMVSPHGTAQKTLLWSSPAQLRLHVNIGLIQEAYDCLSPCPTQVTRFLFKMMSVHSERTISDKILQALCDIACTAAYQIVKNGSQQFQVWVPSLADVVLVLMNMGVAFVTLFPFDNLQPSFTEGDLLEDISIIGERPSCTKGQSTFPEHNCNNILKYLSYCMGLCPRAYSDDELLLLLSVVGKVGLDTRLILESSVELYPLMYKTVNNIRDWNTMLPRICLALTDLTDDHHNMCLVVQLLPDNTRGKQLRRHLSLSMISKLLDGNCTYTPTEKEIQLSELRPYLPRMQPSNLLRCMQKASNQKDKEDIATLDQQSYYLCYSLLTLANEASNFQFFPADQKEQLMSLCSELETYVKCDIRESEKCLYRSKVKDLVARIYIKWQMLLLRTRPLHGQLYDFWQPLAIDTLPGSPKEQETDISDDGEGSVMKEDEEEKTSGTEENEVDMIAEEGRDQTMDDTSETEEDTKPEEMEGENTPDDTAETEEATDLLLQQLNQEMPEMEPQQQEQESKVIDKQIEAGNKEHNEVETEIQFNRRETSQHDQGAACDLVS